MRRLRDYLRFVVCNAGIGYVALWLTTFWTLDYGGAVFGNSGVCQPADAKLLFYWVCERDSPLSILVAVANTALTVTVWAPVYVAAATVYPPAIMLALPIVLTHVIGLPAALLVTIRLMARTLALLHSRRDKQRPQAAENARPVQAKPRPRVVKPRSSFGLRDRGV